MAGLRSRKRRRMQFVVLGLLALGAAVALVLTAFEDNLVFFHSPKDIAEAPPPPDQRLRVGGLVAEGTVVKEGETVRFEVTDLSANVPVVYVGLLPDLFREGQGVVAEGHLDADGLFRADEVLAKHDENYMPPEVAEALKESGQWQGPESDRADAGATLDPSERTETP